jgi:hypothetical protein
MKTLIAFLNRKKISTQRVDDMASAIACSALDQRLQRMLAHHARQPECAVMQYPPLQNPLAQPVQP